MLIFVRRVESYVSGLLTLMPYAVLVLSDGNTTKLDLQGSKEMLSKTSMVNAELSAE